MFIYVYGTIKVISRINTKLEISYFIFWNEIWNFEYFRSFCIACIKNILSPESYSDIILQHPWKCYLCNGRRNMDGIYKIRSDWPEYEKKCVSSTLQNHHASLPILSQDEKQTMVVFLAFDGIARGKNNNEF